MKKYFATLDGDMVGIDRYCCFMAENDEDAQEIADGYAEDNYSEYEDPFNEDGEELFSATIEAWDEEKHGEYAGQACFTDYCRG